MPAPRPACGHDDAGTGVCPYCPACVECHLFGEGIGEGTCPEVAD